MNFIAENNRADTAQFSITPPQFSDDWWL